MPGSPRIYTTGISEHTGLTAFDVASQEKTPHVAVRQHQVVRVDDLIEWLWHRTQEEESNGFRFSARNAAEEIAHAAGM